MDLLHTKDISAALEKNKKGGLRKTAPELNAVVYTTTNPTIIIPKYSGKVKVFKRDGRALLIDPLTVYFND